MTLGGLYEGGIVELVGDDMDACDCRPGLVGESYANQGCRSLLVITDGGRRGRQSWRTIGRCPGGAYRGRED